MAEEQEWFTLFCKRATPRDVAEAFASTLTPEEREEAQEMEKSIPLVRKVRGYITGSQRPEVREDAADGWKYTGSVMRALDALLKVPPPKPRFPMPSPSVVQARTAGTGVPPQDGEADPSKVCETPTRKPICIIEGGGSPGSLGLWWSDFELACDTARLRTACGVTHRLNVAAEVEQKLPERGPGDEGAPLVTVHVGMQDIFSDDEELCEIWVQHLKAVLEVLRAWRVEGAVVNVNCQMGKNRSGAALLVWLCSDGGWEYQRAVEHLRKINPLACANPHLLVALGKVLGIDGRTNLNPAPEGGGWVCISPPASPRGNDAAAQPSFEDLAAQAAKKLAVSQAADVTKDVQDDEVDVVPLFDGLEPCSASAKSTLDDVD